MSLPVNCFISFHNQYRLHWNVAIKSSDFSLMPAFQYSSRCFGCFKRIESFEMPNSIAQFKGTFTVYCQQRHQTITQNTVCLLLFKRLYVFIFRWVCQMNYLQCSVTQHICVLVSTWIHRPNTRRKQQRYDVDSGAHFFRWFCLHCHLLFFNIIHNGCLRLVAFNLQ